jgi:hypothetical protein
MLSELAGVDATIDDFTDASSTQIRRMQDEAIQLGLAHTNDITALINLSVGFDSGQVNIIKAGLERKGSFRLSDAIWGAEHRDNIYRQVLNDIDAGKSKPEIMNTLESYLDPKVPGGQSYVARRVVDTEFQDAYFRSSLESTRQFNIDSPQDRLVYVRELSPAHKVTDICDEVAGVYLVEERVPQIPSHPNCQCILKRRFLSDTKKTPKTLDTNENGDYVSVEFPNQTNRMI